MSRRNCRIPGFHGRQGQVEPGYVYTLYDSNDYAFNFVERQRVRRAIAKLPVNDLTPFPWANVMWFAHAEPACRPPA